MTTDIRLGDCIVRPQRRLIERGDQSVHVTPRAMSVLECLVAARGAPVSRNELFDQVWHGAEVSDDALTKCIGELRRAFGDSARESRVIETIPKLGFRLVPPIELLEEVRLEQARPDQAPPDQAPPDRAPPDQARPDQARPDQARPDQARPDQARPDQAQPATDKSSPRRRARRVGLALLALVLVSGVLLTFATTRTWLTEAGATLLLKTASILSPVRLERAPLIAVLPFVNLSSDADNDYFSDGVSTEIINALARTRRLPVIARSTSFQFRGAEQDVREIGLRLGVTHVLEGSVRRSGEQFRLTTQLVDAGSGELVWSEVYQRELADVFKLQHEIASDIVDQVYLALGYENPELQGELATDAFWQSRHTANPEAYELYLQGMALLNSDRPLLIEQAPDYFDRAIALDSEFADAWAGKGYALWVLGSSVSGSSIIPASVYPDAIAAFRRTLAIEPNHAVATGFLGITLMLNDFQWAEGMRLLERAVQLNPNNAELLAQYGFHLDLFQMDGATEVLERAYRLDPFNLYTIWALAVHLQRQGRPIEAAALVETALIQDREGYASNYLSAIFNLGIGRLDAAEEKIRRAREVAKPVDLRLDVLQWMIDGLRSGTPAPLAKIWERMQTEPLPFVVAFEGFRDEKFLEEHGIEKSRVVEVFELAIEQRHLQVRSALFYYEPPLMPEGEWRRLKEITGATQFEERLRE